MKQIFSSKNSSVYAVGIRYGISSTSDQPYVLLLCSTNDKPSSRSSYSVFLNEQDDATYGIDRKTLDFKSESQTKALPEAIELQGYTLYSYNVAPWGREVTRNDGSTFIRWYDTINIVCDGSSAPQSLADAQVRANYSNADWLAKNLCFRQDYIKYTIFEGTRAELYELMKAEEEKEEKE